MREKHPSQFSLFSFREGALLCVQYKQKRAQVVNVCAEVIPFSSRGSLREKKEEAFHHASRHLREGRKRTLLVLESRSASSRYFKLPSSSARELHNMVSLQAAKVLPYPPGEVAWGYQLVDTDDKGFSHLNTVLIHQDTVQEDITAAKAAGITIDRVYISIYGMQGLLLASYPHQDDELIAVHLYLPGVDIAVMRRGRIALSRYVTIIEEPGWEAALREQILTTQNLYLRQSRTGPLSNITIAGESRIVEEAVSFLKGSSILPIEKIISLPDSFMKQAQRDQETQIDFLTAGIMLKEPEKSLNLLPVSLKRKKASAGKLKRMICIAGIVCLACIFLLVSAFILIQKKKAYLSRLAGEIEAIKEQAKRLENMTSGMRELADAEAQRSKILAFFSVLHEAKPPKIVATRVSFRHAAPAPFSLQGVSPDIETVFAYADGIKESPFFKQGDVKVNYATRDEKENGKMVMFEIEITR